MRKTDLQALVNSNLSSGSQITAVLHREVETALINEIALLYEVKELDCPDAFRIANFDSTGLGINLMVGWAICNGANGTRNRNGRTPIGYDATNYPTIGAGGGSKDAVVVSHSHGATIQSANESQSGNPFGSGGTTIEGTHTYSGTSLPFIIETTGVSGTDKNMQPYIVTLFIQRIA
jgi:hypothetical protein